MLSEIIVGLLALAGTLGGSWMANRKSAALIAYRLEELEKKVDKHNRVVERVYKLEGRMDEAQHDIEELKA